MNPICACTNINRNTQSITHLEREREREGPNFGGWRGPIGGGAGGDGGGRRLPAEREIGRRSEWRRIQIQLVKWQLAGKPPCVVVTVEIGVPDYARELRRHSPDCCRRPRTSQLMARTKENQQIVLTWAWRISGGRRRFGWPIRCHVALFHCNRAPFLRGKFITFCPLRVFTISILSPSCLNLCDPFTHGAVQPQAPRRIAAITRKDGHYRWIKR